MGKIEWTNRSDWNPIRGCTRKSTGCVNCYAETMAARFSDPGQWGHGFAERTPAGGRWTGKVELQRDRLRLPLSWRKPRRIFVNSTSDLFHERLLCEEIDQVIQVIALAPQHTFQVLTKRPERMADYWERFVDRQRLQDDETTLDWVDPPIPNLWLGASIENQEEADERRESLRRVAGQGFTTFVSYEPAIGSVDWGGFEFVDQIISGGESGPKARPSHPNWHRATRDWCQENGVAYFFKQWGGWTPGENVDRQHGHVQTATWFDGQWQFDHENLACTDGHIDDEPDLYRVGKKAAGRLLDGRTWDEFPVERIGAGDA